MNHLNISKSDKDSVSKSVELPNKEEWASRSDLQRFVPSNSESKEVEEIKQELLRRARDNFALIPKEIFAQQCVVTVTIVMLSHGRLEETLGAIRALKEYVRIPYNLLLIDNGSGEEIQDLLRAAVAENEYIKLICLEQNLGCVGGRLFALDHVKTEYVMFIDNDIEIFPGTIEHLLYRLESELDLSAVAGNVIFPSGLVHMCGGEYVVHKEILNYELLGWGKRFDDPTIGQSRRCGWVNGGLTMLRKEFLLRHPYDPLMAGYYEDLEWCYRLTQQGHGNFLRVVEALALHYHVPKHEVLTFETTSPDVLLPLHAVKYIEAISHFHHVHGLIIQNLFDFLPELGPPVCSFQLCTSSLILALINHHGGDWFIEQWRQGNVLLERIVGSMEPGNYMTGSILGKKTTSNDLPTTLALLIALVFRQCALIKEIYSTETKGEKVFTSINEQLIDLEGQVARLAARIAESESVIEALNEKVAEREQQIVAIKTEGEQARATLTARIAESESVIEAQNEKVAEREQQIVAIITEGEQTRTMLAARIAESESVIESLNKKVAEREQQIVAIITEGEQTRSTLAARIAESESVIESLNKKVAEREQQIVAIITEGEHTRSTLAARIAESESVIESLNEKVAEREQQITLITNNVQEVCSQNQALLAFAEGQQRAIKLIENSNAYKLVRLLWAIRRRLRRKPSQIAVAATSHLALPPSELGDTVEKSLTNSLSREDVDDKAKQGICIEDAPNPHQLLNNVPAQLIPLAESYDVILFPVIDWEFRFQRPQQLATQLARAGHRVFYLRTTFHQCGPRVFCQKIEDNVFSVQLPGPANLSLYQHSLKQSVLKKFIQAMDTFRQEVGIEVAVSMVDLPFWTALAVEARSRWGWKIVYDCMDEHAGFSTNTANMVRNEDVLIESSDLVLTTARLLYQKVSARAVRSLMLPNATEFDHFNQPAPVHVLSHLSGPIIGYYGAISDWFDVEMVSAAAIAHPDWQFVLIGSTFGANIELLNILPNVHLLGEQPYAILPSYLARFDVAIIPFLRVSLTEATNPVKFYEYLSAGKPVVSVDLPELQSFSDYFYPVRSRADFVPQIEAALQDRSPDSVRRRVDFARNQTWQTRFQLLDLNLRKLYGKAVIIIVSYNNLNYLKACLESLWTKTQYPNFEVIVVDNGSQPDVIEYLVAIARHESRLKVILNGENLGFAAANNNGIRFASDCDYVVLLNDDTVVTSGWLRKIINHLDNPKVGLIGPVTNNIGNEARINVGYQCIEDMEAFARKYSLEHSGESSEINVLAMFCVGIRKDVLDQVGLLDERFGVGMFEDDDYSMRVRKAGYRIVLAEDIFIHHWGGASFKKIDQESYQKIFEDNLRRFEDKWGHKWQPHKYRPGVTV